MSNARNLANLLGTGTRPSGSIVQVKGDNHTSAVNIETTSTTPIGTDLEISITFGSTSNKFLAMLHVPDFYNYNVPNHHSVNILNDTIIRCCFSYYICII